ncbi:MAG: hypothetical protein ACXVQR_04120 [Solirubrobacteraceae bacterium]
MVYLTCDYMLAAGAGTGLAETRVGEAVFSEAAVALREAWLAGVTTASFMDSLLEFAPAIAHDLPGGAAELRAPDGRYAGSAVL